MADADLITPVRQKKLAGAETSATKEDPVLRVYRELIAARREWCGAGARSGWDSDAAEAASSREDALLYAIADMTPTSMAGIAAVAAVLWDLAGPGLAEGSELFNEDVEQPNNKLIIAIWRAASGKKGFPNLELGEGLA